MSKNLPCDRRLFGTQAEYEECLDERRSARRRGQDSEAMRLSKALENRDLDEADED